MVDSVVKMVEVGCQFIVVFGVDFMLENVRVIFDQVGYEKVNLLVLFFFSFYYIFFVMRLMIVLLKNKYYYWIL